MMTMMIAMMKTMIMLDPKFGKREHWENSKKQQIQEKWDKHRRSGA